MRQRLDQIMNNLFPLILCGIVFSIMKASFPMPLSEMYVYSSFPAGWYFLSTRKKRERTKSDTDIIVKEIRRVRYDDSLMDVVFFFVRKGMKLAISIVIGFLLVPYYAIAFIWGLFKIITFNSIDGEQYKDRDKRS
jgi:hypothetical protein